MNKGYAKNGRSDVAFKNEHVVVGGNGSLEQVGATVALGDGDGLHGVVGPAGGALAVDQIGKQVECGLGIALGNVNVLGAGNCFILLHNIDLLS